MRVGLRTTSPPPPPPAMIRVICVSPEQIDAIWRMLSHVPDDAFYPCEVWLDGVRRYEVIRTEGEQTTAQPVDLQGSNPSDP
jgi:hypothetical protein